MNVTFRLPAEDLERAFVSSAADAGMAELKGHRSVGGIRASIYNAMPLEGVQALADFMRDFAGAAADADAVSPLRYRTRCPQGRPSCAT